MARVDLSDGDNVFFYNPMDFGGDPNAEIYGNGGDDVISGSTGSDLLDGGAGEDALLGGNGDDVLIGGPDADNFAGGNDIDWASYRTATHYVGADLLFPGLNAFDAFGDTYNDIENLEGSAFNDGLGGDDNANQIRGLDGDDVIGGRGGNDQIYGGNGNDILYGDGGGDRIDGGPGTDWASYIGSPTGVNVDLGSPGSNSGGEAPGDTYFSIENLQGSQQLDQLFGDDFANRIDGLDGNDDLRGRDGSDQLFGGNDNDILSGEGGNDALSGDTGGDFLDGGSGSDAANYANAASSVVADLANSDANTSDATGDIYNSIENLTGSSFNDVLTGDGAANVLNGLAGNDTLGGAGGPDHFRFDTALDALNNVDTIVSFSGADTIDLDNAVFTKLKATGVLKDKFFHIGKQAGDHNDYVLYNKKTGDLSYDADGDRTKFNPVEFAHLDAHLKLTHNDFLIV